MRVALLTSANGWRGSGASYAKLARGLRDRGHTARLVTSSGSLSARLRDEGLEVTEISRTSRFRAVWGLRRALRSMRAQVIIADTAHDVRLAACVSALRRARILYRYNVHYRRPRRPLVDRVCLGRVTACVYQSRYIHLDAVKHVPRMSRIPSFEVPNGYDTRRYAPHDDAAAAFRDQYRIPPSARVVLTAARLTKNKGHEIALAALNRVHREGLDLLWVVCGDGNRERELVSLAGAYNLPTRFTGLLDSRAMVGAYSAADLVVHPSLQEIFPNAVGEAMACARPVIAADAGGTGELIGRDGTAGVLVPPADPDALADAVRTLCADPCRLRGLGEAARRRIQDVFTVDLMIERYERLLAELVDGGA
jgi:glycosyltransferase involved in cell wall biosynthesis